MSASVLLKGSNTRPAVTARRGRSRHLRILLSVADFLVGLVILTIVWALLASTVSPILFPGPAHVFATAIEMIRTGEVITDLTVSLERIAVGYALGVVSGTLIGLLLGEFRLLDRLFGAVISSLRVLPAVALVPLAIIWFGIGEPSKYFVIMYATAVISLFAAYDGVRRTPRTRLLAARSMGASKRQILFDVVLPSAVPYIWTGMRIGVGFAFASVVAAELIAANEGVGALIMNARTLLQTDRMFVGLGLLAVAGGITDRIFTAIMEKAIGRYIDYVRH
jgi:ABC-type nitrate/sulfonate/bicarbonate transport system permease component